MWFVNLWIWWFIFWHPILFYCSHRLIISTFQFSKIIWLYSQMYLNYNEQKILKANILLRRQNVIFMLNQPHIVGTNSFENNRFLNGLFFLLDDFKWITNIFFMLGVLHFSQTHTDLTFTVQRRNWETVSLEA